MGLKEFCKHLSNNEEVEVFGEKLIKVYSDLISDEFNPGLFCRAYKLDSKKRYEKDMGMLKECIETLKDMPGIHEVLTNNYETLNKLIISVYNIANPKKPGGKSLNFKELMSSCTPCDFTGLRHRKKKF